ncbi:MAG TPA: glycosyltransferase family 4 protein [Thermoflexales bacterium]|nr:glycosyltransferase family 4 protein [Thermoflexales bacterium]HQW36556.1 glycosyltransferase family 4 protein [Thermoflexales bacterium]HQZ22588.1 glycosyltransferase family 4 protein [Thermoflexales bacterium]HQZ99005.1 glycosyltransferase family 4 protein [Thermoflexales bacterium]
MKIVVLHYSAPPVTGGVEITIQHHARCLSDLGHECVMVAGEGGNAGDSRVGFVRIPRMSSHHPDVLAVKRELDAGRVPPEFAVLRDGLRDELLPVLKDADVIVIHNIITLNKNLALAAALRSLCDGVLADKRWVGWHHDFAWTMEQYGDELHAGMPWHLLREPWPNVINVVVSEARRDALALLYNLSPDTIHVAHPGIDEAQLQALTPVVARISRAVENADLILLQPSRITRRKNIEMSLKTLAVLRERTGLDIRLLVSGPIGPHNPSNAVYLDMLNAIRDQQTLRDKALFLRLDEIGGERLREDLSDADLGALYRMCDILFLPSTDEGFGIPILEAVAVGRAIVCSDLPPLRASGGETATYIDPRGSAEDAAAAIAGLIAKMPRILQRRRTLRRCSWRTITERDVLPILSN